MVPCVSSIHLSSKGAIASPYLIPLLTLNSEYNCLSNLTLTFISLFKILHNLTIFEGKPILCISVKDKNYDSVTQSLTTEINM